LNRVFDLQWVFNIGRTDDVIDAGPGQLPSPQATAERGFAFRVAAELDRSPTLLKAHPAQNRAPLGGAERDGCFFVAKGADGPGFHTFVNGSRPFGNRGEKRRPLGLAAPAAFGLVLELLVMEEELFTGGKREISSAVHTNQRFVLKFHREKVVADRTLPSSP
jgi:hypothetical protein